MYHSYIMITILSRKKYNLPYYNCRYYVCLNKILPKKHLACAYLYFIQIVLVAYLFILNV